MLAWWYPQWLSRISWSGEFEHSQPDIECNNQSATISSKHHKTSSWWLWEASPKYPKVPKEMCCWLVISNVYWCSAILVHGMVDWNELYCREGLKPSTSLLSVTNSPKSFLLDLFPRWTKRGPRSPKQALGPPQFYPFLASKRLEGDEA